MTVQAPAGVLGSAVQAAPSNAPKRSFKRSKPASPNHQGVEASPRSYLSLFTINLSEVTQ